MAAAVRADGGERGALALAAVAHVALFALLSLSWHGERPRDWPKPAPIEVSLVDKVAPETTAPPSPVPPAPSVAPDQGTPAAAPAPAPAPEPKPQPKPEPAKPEPAPVSKPKPEAAKPVALPKPAPEPDKTAPKPTPAKPAPAKPAPAKPAAAAPSAASARPAAAAPARTSRLAGLGQELAAGAKADAHAARPRGARLGDNFLKGLAPDAPARTASDAAPAARAGPYPTSSIVGAIARQIQPCADRQVDPGPGANRITTILNIRLNADGTLAASPRMVRQAGVDDGNERYAQRVADLGIAAFKGCTPLRLPAEYYQTASGGWSNINYQWKLR